MCLFFFGNLGKSLRAKKYLLFKLLKENCTNNSCTSVLFDDVQVPLADVLNHVTENNACLEFEPDRLVMKATCDIQAGFEVYNTYGQLSNAQLLQVSIKLFYQIFGNQFCIFSVLCLIKAAQTLHIGTNLP